ncbi:MAG: polyhydroxyalkanoate granule-associated phasin [Lautropia sp.]
MMKRRSGTRRHGGNRLTRQTAELALAAPQVVAHRLSRIALAGAAPGARDRQEMVRMGAEKVQAFHESWGAMVWEAWRQQQRWLQSWMTMPWLSSPWLTTQWLPWAGFAQHVSRPGDLGRLQRAMTGIASAGLAPVHRRAVANSRRLGGRKRRS